MVRKQFIFYHLNNSYPITGNGQVAHYTGDDKGSDKSTKAEFRIDAIEKVANGCKLKAGNNTYDHEHR